MLACEYGYTAEGARTLRERQVDTGVDARSIPSPYQVHTSAAVPVLVQAPRAAINGD